MISSAVAANSMMRSETNSVPALNLVWYMPTRNAAKMIWPGFSLTMACRAVCGLPSASRYRSSNTTTGAFERVCAIHPPSPPREQGNDISESHGSPMGIAMVSDAACNETAASMRVKNVFII